MFNLLKKNIIILIAIFLMFIIFSFYWQYPFTPHEKNLEYNQEEPSQHKKEEPSQHKKEEPSQHKKEEPSQHKKEEPSQHKKEEPSKYNQEEPSKYEEIIRKINLEDSKNFIEAENFIIQNENIYGTLTSLCLAKKYILENNFEKALIQLKNSLKYTKEENLKNILLLRITKIEIQNLKNQNAMNILENIKDDNWKNIVENMKGDIFINQKNKKEAIKSWKNSLLIENSNASKEIIQMKINEQIQEN